MFGLFALFSDVLVVASGLESAFTGKLKVTVEDVHLVMNYYDFLTPCRDTSLGRLHKEEQTQHTWMFEAVDPSVHFPLGVKTCYRAYCSDKVVEFQKMDPLECTTSIGRLTGLEPVVTISHWYPSASGIGMDPLRPNIEGFYLLRSLPSGILTPAPFNLKCHEIVSATLSEVFSR